MPKAKWNGIVIAESDRTVVVENNHYFPADSLKQEYFQPSEKNKTTTCSWKGECHYYDIVVNGKKNPDAGWFYPTPKAAADNIKGMVAFWKGVEVE